ncbi:sensor histidine kinase [Pseudokineococcus sp. 1T1Z-3]|uniref:sensor histidine kinase n=1 Tax=Pseudokineococcus sp. 1T1Z-3 TaxID=3132745 RepID=UPI0030972293
MDGSARAEQLACSAQRRRRDLVRRAPRGDLVLSALGLVMTALYWVVAAQEPSWTSLAQALLTTALAALLVVRRTAVVAAAVATTLLLAAMAVLALLAPVALGANPVLLCAPLSVAAVTEGARPRWAGVVALAVGVAGSAVSPVVLQSQARWWAYGAHVAVLLLAYVWASRRRAVRAGHRREVEARVALARAQERVRISAELHDVLGHSLTVIHAQANAALAHDDGRRERAALLAVRSVAKTSLADIRSLVTVLRGEEGEDAHAELDVTTSLHQTLAHAEAAGLRVEADLPPREVLTRWQSELAPATLRALARCVQEGTTNAVRHAGPGQWLGVRVSRGAGGVVVALSSTSDRRADAVGSGHGLLGLEERVRLLGGTFCAGPTETGFRVEAVLPTSPGAPGGER